jgi:hypothetical protein
MVVVYNDSFGFYNNTRGVSGFSYSTNGGETWIDGGGLSPLVPSPLSPFSPTPPGVDRYLGDPVVVVHHRTGTFYYSSLYQSVNGYFTLSVNRGRFEFAPPQGVESFANTRSRWCSPTTTASTGANGSRWPTPASKVNRRGTPESLFSSLLRVSSHWECLPQRTFTPQSAFLASKRSRQLPNRL